MNGLKRTLRNRLLGDHSNFKPLNIKHAGALCLVVSISPFTEMEQSIVTTSVIFSSSLM